MAIAPLTVVEEPEFSKKHDAMLAIYPKLHDWKMGLDWFFAKTAKAGRQIIEKPGYWIVIFPETAGVPSSRIIYKYNEKAEPGKVYLVNFDLIQEEIHEEKEQVTA